ncbi:homeobox-leucine zipper protein ROC8-like [Olea europaea var. sylvestris]|uniref:homeobox-leucine zipper protein ROC8-like n=1 Tax=Olea europaea var. sylvestris TaxID=158386 RepID=UPI000C1D55AD|nr:homeobox-leucine zipper protein ROC8-like [Olea europaea var. sylvestris]
MKEKKMDIEILNLFNGFLMNLLLCLTAEKLRKKWILAMEEVDQLLKNIFFKECPYPDENQMRQLSRELALDPKQIKFWFQNKRTQAKAQHERAENITLRSENERIQCENLAMKEALNNVICRTCGGPRLGEEEKQCNIQKLRMENYLLKKEHERKLNSYSSFMGKLPTSLQAASLGVRSPLNVPGKQFFSQGMEGRPIDPEQISWRLSLHHSN